MAFAAVVFALAGGEALAHARLKSASPAPEATVQPGLTAIQLVFNEEVEPAFSVVGLASAAGESVANSEGTPICEARTCTLTVPPLAAGSYAVTYHVLSADGHVVEGHYTFLVAD